MHTYVLMCLGCLGCLGGRVLHTYVLGCLGGRVLHTYVLMCLGGGAGLGAAGLAPKHLKHLGHLGLAPPLWQGGPNTSNTWDTCVWAARRF